MINRNNPLFVRTPLQTKLFPCDDKYNAREISDLQESWAEVIKNTVLPLFGKLEIVFAKYYHKTMGRPIKYISLLIVLHVFREMYDWTDEEMLENVRFDKRFEYAFDLPYEELTVCQKTLHNFRALLQTHEIASTIFDKATGYIAKAFNIDTSQQRLDSTHIVSNMARLSRLALFVRVTENFLYKLKKIDPEGYDSLPSRFRERYAKRRGYFADARSKKTKHRLGEVAKDMYDLLDRFFDSEEISSLKVTLQLKRVFDEHCKIETDIVIVKEPKELPPRTLQNPSDEDVTCGYKGSGYEATFAETCSKENPFQVITDTQTDPSDQSDQHKTLKVAGRLENKDMKPKVLYTDGGFTSGDNIVECDEKDIDLQGNLVGADKNPDKLKLADFEFDPDGITTISCPAGEKPAGQRKVKARKSKSKSRQMFLVHFDLDTCKNCSLLDRCPVKLQKKKAVLRFSRSQLATSLRRREQETQIFKERNNIRAGIESINAEMKKSQGLGRLRVRGQPRVDQTVVFKALACNIKRMVKYVQSLPKCEPTLHPGVYFNLNLKK